MTAIPVAITELPNAGLNKNFTQPPSVLQVRGCIQYPDLTVLTCASTAPIHGMKAAAVRFIQIKMAASPLKSFSAF